MSNSLTNDKISSLEVLTETNAKKCLNNTVVNTTNGSNAKSDDKKSIESDGNVVNISDLQLFLNESKSLIEIITPISVCMLLAILSIQFFPIFITGILNRN